MAESDMAKPVMDWLETRGATPYGEVLFNGYNIDVVGIHRKRNEVDIVEMKLNLSATVIQQAVIRRSMAHRSWIAVASKPRRWADRLSWPALAGLGLLRVSSGSCEILREPADSTPLVNMALLIERCHQAGERGEAGTPTTKGVGPAQRVYDAVADYLSEKQDASWREIYDSVPNHYASAASMRGAMATVQGTRARRLDNPHRPTRQE